MPQSEGVQMVQTEGSEDGVLQIAKAQLSLEMFSVFPYSLQHGTLQAVCLAPAGRPACSFSP